MIDSAFAGAQPTKHPFLPVVGNVITPSQAGRGFGKSPDTIIRWIKSYMAGEGGLAGFVVGTTRDGRPMYATTDYYCLTHFKRMNPQWGKR